jgi:ribonuclease PH
MLFLPDFGKMGEVSNPRKGNGRRKTNMRADGRKPDELRPFKVTLHPNKYAEGSVLIEAGDTKVLCTASVEERVPPFLKGQGRGWVTAEYSMLPRATHSRNQRESMKGKPAGRTMEIQRLIGRALRSIVLLDALGERTITIDCDVLQADGGTRTTSITGGFLALALAVHKLSSTNTFARYPLADFLASVSVGVLQERVLLDLNYEEDSKAKVDMNVVMTGAGSFVEVQGTGEESPFTRAELDGMLKLAESGINSLVDWQKRTLGEAGVRIGEDKA